MPKWLPSAEYLRECFDYDPDTGVLIWRARPLHHFKNADYQRKWNSSHAGKQPGSPNPRYLNIGLHGRVFLAHRIIWMMQTGNWPNQIDHKNRDGTDNRWHNLREATHQQNKWNRNRPERILPRGVRGLKNGRFVAHLYGTKDDGSRTLKSLGTYDTPEEAHAAWLAAVSEERGEFLRPD